jgi:hypothetical protein
VFRGCWKPRGSCFKLRALRRSRHSREGVKAFIAQHGSNRARHSLAVAEYDSGGRRGFVIIPKGKGGRGWSGFAIELRRFLDAFQKFYGSGKGTSGPVLRRELDVVDKR